MLKAMNNGFNSLISQMAEGFHEARFHDAVIYCNMRFIRIHLKAGRVNERIAREPPWDVSTFSLTALHLIASGLPDRAQEEYFEVAQALIEAGADLELATLHDGCTALHYAALQNNLELVKRLLLKGAKVNAITNHRETPLYLAVEKGHDKVVEVLLNYGADINLPRKNNIWRPLSVAINGLCFCFDRGSEKEIRDKHCKIINLLIESSKAAESFDGVLNTESCCQAIKLLARKIKILVENPERRISQGINWLELFQTILKNIKAHRALDHSQLQFRFSVCHFFAKTGQRDRVDVLRNELTANLDSLTKAEQLARVLWSLRVCRSRGPEVVATIARAMIPLLPPVAETSTDAPRDPDAAGAGAGGPTLGLSP